MPRSIFSALVLACGFAAVLLCQMVSPPARAQALRHKAPPVLAFTMRSLDGRPVHLEKYLGKVVMIVNTASKCGYTPQYAGLEALYKKYHARGLVILGFPANDFAHQEPGTDKQISIFCTRHYGVTFPMFSKIHVKGPKQCALYHFLTARKTDPRFPGPIGWNFEKFIISRRGRIVARFRSPVKPESAAIMRVVRAQLAQSAH